MRKNLGKIFPIEKNLQKNLRRIPRPVILSYRRVRPRKRKKEKQTESPAEKTKPPRDNGITDRWP